MKEGVIRWNGRYRQIDRESELDNARQRSWNLIPLIQAADNHRGLGVAGIHGYMDTETTQR
jgi:hypothetical protein